MITAALEYAQMLLPPTGWNLDAYSLVIATSPAGAIRLMVEDRRRRQRHIGPRDIEEILNKNQPPQSPSSTE